MSRIHISTLVIGIACLTWVTGCGGGGKSGEVEVRGTVTVDGEPVERGSVTFLAADHGGAAGGGVINNGEYVASVTPGEKIVMVMGSKKVGEKLRLEGVPDSGMEEEFKTVTHANYNAQRLTPLRANIEGRTNDLNFELTSDGKGG